MGDEYTDNLEHLQDELRWLDLVIRLGVLRARSPSRKLAGVCVSDAAVDEMLSDSPADEVALSSQAQLIEQIDATRAAIQRRIAVSGEQGIPLLLPRLAHLFSLSPFEVDVALVCLAPELDRKYERLYGYLQDDVTRRVPSVELIFHLLCDSLEQRVLARRAFLLSGRLARYHLVQCADTRDPAHLLLSRSLQLDDGIVHYLLGGKEIDPRLASCARLIPPAAEPDGDAEALALDTPLLPGLQRYLSQPQAGQWIAVLHGPDRASQTELACALCAALRLPLLQVELEALLEQEMRFEQAIRLVFRDAALKGAAVYLEHSEALARDGDKATARARSFEGAMRDMGWTSFVAGTHPWEPSSSLKEHQLFFADFPVPSYPQRRHLWEAALNGRQPLAADLEVSEVAAHFRFTREEIQNAAYAARNLALLRDGPAGTLTRADLQTACRAESSPRLLSFARKILTRYAWNELVLPEEQKTQLREIIAYIRHHEAVYTDWGFGQKHAMGRGTNVLFTGPSGTGKTMAAGMMAGELGLDLYKIDLSTVVSKYIGETEKNLQRVFKEAETSNAILFFDEADALFGKRSEVKDSHDRYANIEVNYLLQKMEEHEGIVILATNFSKNVDDAFLRRLHFAVLFPSPEKAERLHIWRQVFPSAAPLADDVDFEFLARRLKIAGGNIKNIALGAAFLAQSGNDRIGMRHIVLAAKREFQKVGKICVKADFGEYYELVS